MNFNADLHATSVNLFNTDLVKTKTASAKNIEIFQMFLNNSIPTDEYGKSIRQFVNFLFHHDKQAYYGFVEKSDLRHYILLTNGMAIAGYLGVKNIVKIELTGDRYSVEPIAQVAQIAQLERSRESTPERGRRKRGGVGRNRNNGDRNGDRNNGDRNGDRDYRNGERNSDRDYRNDRNSASNRGVTNATKSSVMILGINTEVASHHVRPARAATYADKLKQRTGDRPVVVIPPIPAENYAWIDKKVITATVVPVTDNTDSTALEQLTQISWGGDDA